MFGAPPERDVTRWFSDASALTRYGVPTVNYGTSTGLLDTEKGENLDIDGLVQTAQVYALAAARALRGRVSVYSLPPDLPAPVDDGACDHLPGSRVPALCSTRRTGRSTWPNSAPLAPSLYVYPRTGHPSREVPAGWDAIPGARGCTPQSCGFRDHAAELRSPARASPASRRRRSTSRSSSPSGCTCPSR